MTEKTPKLALYPVYQYKEGFEPPTTGKYYLICADGVYFHKETKVGSGLVKVKGIPWLETPRTGISLQLPKLPGRIVAQALSFFRRVFQEYKSEAYVTLMYSPKLGYQLWCPKQSVTSGSVHYDRTDQPEFAERNAEGWQMVGTIHSHCDFSAFHSGTDTFDESTFDGIHITIGHVNRDQFSMCSSLAFNDQRETMEPEQCCLGILRVGDRNVQKSTFMTWSQATYFELALSDEDAMNLVDDKDVIEQEWMPKVTHGYGGNKGGASGNSGGTFPPPKRSWFGLFGY